MWMGIPVNNITTSLKNLSGDVCHRQKEDKWKRRPGRRNRERVHPNPKTCHTLRGYVLTRLLFTGNSFAGYYPFFPGKVFLLQRFHDLRVVFGKIVCFPRIFSQIV